MENREDSDVDDDFSELYKEYTGPPVLSSTRSQDATKGNKRSHAGCDDDVEEEPQDPNDVPTDFTSREAKFWEAKSKATERIWKKRKEEEMICKICGDSGHFTQGCPSTLGANRKSQDFFERVPAREPHVKALFSDKVVSNIEKEIGCKIKIDEKFIIVSGKDRLILAKGVDAVRKIKEEGDKKDKPSSQMTRSKSPDIHSPVGSQFTRSDSQRSIRSPQTASLFEQRFGRQEKKVVEDRVRDGLKNLSRGSPQGRDSIGYIYGARTNMSSFGEAYGNDGARSHPSQSKSPAHPAYTGVPYNLYEGQSQSRGGYRTNAWEVERRGPEMQLGRKLDYPTGLPQSLEELELQYKRETMDLARVRDKQEDEENYKHREAVRELRENYMKRLAILRAMHAKQWEGFLQHDAQKKQQMAHQQLSTSVYGGYRQPAYSVYDDGSSVNPRYAGGNLPMEPRGSRYQNSMGNYPSSRSHDTYSDFQSQKHDEFGKAYNRY